MPAGSPLTEARLRSLGRLVLGPAIVGAVAGFELAGRGAVTAAVGAYAVFVLAHHAVVFWTRRQLRLARGRLASRRSR